MFGLSLALMLSLSGISQDPRLEKIIPVWTGRNGYEEYVRAAQLLSAPQVTELNRYVRYRETGKWDEETTKPEAPPGTDPETLLDVYRIQAKALEPALKLIRQGNTKPVFYPNPSRTILTLYPELAPLKWMMRDLQRYAYVGFSEGKGAEGTQAILDTFSFGDRIECGPMLHSNVAQSIRDFARASFLNRLGQMSLYDLQKIRSWADYQVRQPVGMIEGARQEAREVSASYYYFLNHPEELAAFGGNKEALVQAVSKLTESHKAEVYRLAFQRLEAPWLAIADRLSKPESQWLGDIDTSRFLEGSGTSSPLSPGDGVWGMAILKAFNALAYSIDPGEVVKEVAKDRVKTRLLGIYASVGIFRWQQNRLPESLEEVFGKAPTESLSGSRYTYERLPDGKFRVFCQINGLGEIHFEPEEKGDTEAE